MIPAVHGMFRDLLRKAESGAARPRMALDYATLRSERRLADALDAVDLLARAGAVRPRHDARAGNSHLVKGVEVLDAGTLAAALGEEPLSVRLERVRRAIVEVGGTTPDPRLEHLASRCEARWATWRSAWGLGVDDLLSVQERFALIRGLLAGEAAGLDERTFSARTFGSRGAADGSKVLAAHRGGLASMLREAVGVEATNPSEVLAAFGLLRLAGHVVLRGPVEMDDGSGPRTCRSPYDLVHMDWIGCLRWRDGLSRRAVLTVENWSPFHRHIALHEQPGPCVIYLGGMPSPVVVAALRHLGKAAPDVEFHHWGDVDAGGLAILAFIERALDREICPHLMDVRHPCSRTLPEDDGKTRRRLARLASGQRWSAVLARRLLESGRFMEQEVLNPEPLPPVRSAC